jgi:hypothetical protein
LLGLLYAHMNNKRKKKEIAGSASPPTHTLQGLPAGGQLRMARSLGAQHRKQVQPRLGHC